MVEVRNLKGKKVCCIGNRKAVIKLRGITTVLDFLDPDNPKIINKRRK